MNEKDLSKTKLLRLVYANRGNTHGGILPNKD